MTYKLSGVDIDAGNTLVDRIKKYAAATKRNGVISSIGGYAGLFALSALNKKDPVLVATTDGVGTKLKLALQTGLIEGLGQDLVAMCVNDLICCGAEPLFFLDYYAAGKLNFGAAESIIKNMTACLQDIHCTLLGGETAEMPGLYHDGDFDLAGFAVGVVEKDHVIDGSQVSLGNKIIGLKSSGFHANGFSLVRKIVQDKNLNLRENFHGKTLAEHLLSPTTIYVNPILNLLKTFRVSALAHITGGGLVENIPRVIPKTCQAVIEKKLIPTPEIIKYIADAGVVPESDRWRTFNMGIGFVVIVKKSDEIKVLDHLEGCGMPGVTIGTIEKRKATEAGVALV